MQDETTTSAPGAGEQDSIAIWNELMAAEQKETASEDTPEPLIDADQVEAVTEAVEGDDQSQANEANTDALQAADDTAAATVEGGEGAPEAPKKTELEQLRDENNQLKHERSSNRGRITSLQRKIQAERHSRGNSKPPPAVEGEEEAFKEVYPRVAAQLEQQVAQAQAASIQREAADHDERAELIGRETAALLNEHPDVADLINGNQEALAAFLQSDNITRKQLSAFKDNQSEITDARAASEFMTAFKGYLGPKDAAGQQPDPATPPTSEPDPAKQALADKRKLQMDATDAPAAGGGKPALSGLPENASDEQIWKYWQDQESRQKR